MVLSLHNFLMAAYLLYKALYVHTKTLEFPSTNFLLLDQLIA